jgi:nitrile hydratase subunit beta
MNGVHDLGGMDGMGAVERDVDEPVFQAAWERTVFGIATAVLGQELMDSDQLRAGIERMPAVEYLTAPYYQRWLHSVQQHLLGTGILTADELAERLQRFRDDPSAPVPRRENAALTASLYALVVESGSPQRDVDRDPRFVAGDRVRTRNLHPEGHTRLPRYARDKVGEVVDVGACFVFPDTNASGEGEHPQHVYRVRFEAATLWGPSAEPRSAVYLDLWEVYLEPAEVVR